MAARKGTRPPNAGKGRKSGVPNKATADVRAAIALILEANVGKFREWLLSVAEGERHPSIEDEDGEIILGEWLRRPDPGLALKLAMDMAEYHIPKLARTEHTGGDGTDLALQVKVQFVAAK